MSRETDELGRRGEQLAADDLTRRGYRVLDRRVRTRFGEIDLIVEAANLVVYVEVKTRRGTRFGAPADAISWHKAERLRRCVTALRQQRRDLRDRPCRIDVVEILWPASGEPRITHIESAVEGGPAD